MKVTISGASGFIGRKVIERLLAEGHDVHALGRTSTYGKPVRFSKWDVGAGEPPEEALAGAGAVIHLAGEPVAQRWSPEVKRRIRESRVTGTRHLIQALSTQSPRPGVLIAASAIGFYGDRGDEILTEESEAGDGFLPDLCIEWEQQSRLAESLGMRVVLLRIGLVLGRGGGALEPMLRAFKYGAGAKLGSGEQWMSWIHLDDLAGLILWSLDRRDITGPVNGVSPTPVRNAEFTATLANVLHRPAFFSLPRFALRMTMGEIGTYAFDSQRVVPGAARKAGYEFRHPELRAALEHLTSSRPAPNR